VLSEQENIVNSDILNQRMTEVTLKVFKADGSALAGQEVVIEQTKHKFLFGTAAWWVAPVKLITDSPGGRQFRGCPGEYALSYDVKQIPFTVTRENATRLEVSFDI
jgi:hypothetical protein